MGGGVVVAEWSKVLTGNPWPIMVWYTSAVGTYQLRFVSWVFPVIFSFVRFISLYTLGGMCAFRTPVTYNIYLFNLRIANHILKEIYKCILYLETLTARARPYDHYYKMMRKWYHKTMRSRPQNHDTTKVK